MYKNFLLFILEIRFGKRSLLLSFGRYSNGPAKNQMVCKIKRSTFNVATTAESTESYSILLVRWSIIETSTVSPMAHGGDAIATKSI